MKKYKLCLETDYKNKMIAAAGDYDIIVIDAQDYTKSEIKKIKSNDVIVLTYLNVGAIESERSYFNDIKNKGLLVSMIIGMENGGSEPTRMIGENTLHHYQCPFLKKV